MKQTKTKHLLIAPLAIAIGSLLFYHFVYPYHLFFKEQIQLFLFTPDYLASYFNKPASVSLLFGDFLTQFFFLRGGGPLVLALVFAMEWMLIRAVLKRTLSLQTAGWWALLPVVADITSHLALSYPLGASVGLILLLSIFLLTERIKNKVLASLIFLLLAVFAHPFFGSSAFVLPFLVLFNKRFYQHVLTAIISFLVITAIPYFLRPNYLLPLTTTYLFPLIYWKGLLLPATFAGTLLIAKMLAPMRIFQSAIGALAVSISMAIAITGFLVNANFNLEKILALDSETYFRYTDKVIELAEKYELKTRVATYYTNMALAQKNELSERLLEFYQPSFYGLILPVSQKEYWQTILFSNELFYLIGDMNLAQHSAMLGNTFSPYYRSSRMMKRLAEINMVNGDYEGAEKFLRMLDKTLFHKNWAEKHLKENHPGSKAKWLETKRQQIAKNDTIRNGTDYLSALEFLVEQNPQNRIALDYLLCYHLLNKDLTAFKTAYDRYAKMQFSVAPKVYGEALLIILFKENASEETLQEYKIQSQQISDFIKYTSRFEDFSDDLDAMKKNWGTSYWFYFHYATMMEEEE
ncbi:DUF6057 family protein [Maribellus mangrovi]|uniref:DUF6057 family protein n=1 Tax=Maribellus mangrovi TaxID=3133146 RepID=UPI0030EF5B7A